MTVQDEKDQAVKKLAELVYICIISLIIAGAILAGFFIVMMMASPVYEFFAYDVLGYDRPSYGSITSEVYHQPEIFDPTLDDQMLVLAKMAYLHQEDDDFVQDVYKNCVFGLKYQLESESEHIHGFDMFVDDYGSNRICYQSMKDQLTESLKYVLVQQKFLQVDFLHDIPVQTKTSENDL